MAYSAGRQFLRNLRGAPGNLRESVMRHGRPTSTGPPTAAHGSSTPKALLKRLVQLACPTAAVSFTRCSGERDSFSSTMTVAATVAFRVSCSANAMTDFSRSLYAPLAAYSSSDSTCSLDSPAL